MKLEDFFINVLVAANSNFPEKNDGSEQIDHVGRQGDILYGHGQCISIETVDGLLSLRFNNVNLSQLGSFFLDLDARSEKFVQLTGSALLAGYFEDSKTDDRKILGAR